MSEIIAKRTQMVTITKRIDALDLLKAFAIFLVVWGHVLQHCLSSNYIDEPVYRFIYSFHMPLFMILAGFFSRGSLNLDFGQLLYKKGKELILPCITWGGVIYLLILASHYLSGKGNEFSVIGLLKYLLEDYWFLKSLFLSYLIAWCCLRLNNRWFFILGILLVQFFNHFSMPIMFPCFIVGYYLKEVIDNPNLLRFKNAALMVFILLLLYSLVINKQIYDGEYESCLIDGGFIGYAKIALLRIYRLILGISGSLFIIIIARKHFGDVSAQSSKVIGYVCNIGRNSLGIYLIHTLLVSYIMAKYIKFDSIDPLFFNVIVVPIITAIIIFFSMFVITILSRNRCLRVAFFGK